MLNTITIMGRLTRDPELRRTSSGVAVVSFTLACERDFAPQGADKETDFIDVCAWRYTAEFVEKYFSKGQMAVVTRQTSNPQLGGQRGQQAPLGGNPRRSHLLWRGQEGQDGDVRTARRIQRDHRR